MKKKKPHCPTCTCHAEKEIRHTCKHCHTKKMEKYMTLVGEITGWGHGGYWECTNKEKCLSNKNYA